MEKSWDILTEEIKSRYLTSLEYWDYELEIWLQI